MIYTRQTENERLSITKHDSYLKNTSLHLSNKFVKYMQVKGIKCLTIPAYSPQLNPAEENNNIYQIEDQITLVRFQSL